MLSQDFLNNIRDVNLSCAGTGDNKKEKSYKKENTILSNIKLESASASASANVEDVIEVALDVDHTPKLSFLHLSKKFITLVFLYHC